MISRKIVLPGIGLMLLALLLCLAGCSGTSGSPAPASVPTTEQTAIKTPTPQKEIVYVYVTVTVTPPTPTPIPARTKDELAVADFPVFSAWRYQYIAKDDGSFHYGKVRELLLHLGNAPDEKSYQTYYLNGRRWREDLERLIREVQNSIPTVRSAGMRASMKSFNESLQVQNGTIRTLDRVLTNWEFARAGRVTNGIVVNITNATARMDTEISLIT